MPADLAVFYFVGKLCMTNSPQDCQRVVFDRPIYGNYLRQQPVMPMAFQSRGACLRAIPAHFTLQQPLAVEGSRWVERGCTEEN